eukprot:6189805-Pleurochrysis_carterae.AAC.6
MARRPADDAPARRCGEEVLVGAALDEQGGQDLQGGPRLPRHRQAAEGGDGDVRGQRAGGAGAAQPWDARAALGRALDDAQDGSAARRQVHAARRHRGAPAARDSHARGRPEGASDTQKRRLVHFESMRSDGMGKALPARFHRMRAAESFLRLFSFCACSLPVSLALTFALFLVAAFSPCLPLLPSPPCPLLQIHARRTDLRTRSEPCRAAQVCDKAAKEFAIEKALNDMAAAWEGIQFEVLPYRATGTAVIKASADN